MSLLTETRKTFKIPFSPPFIDEDVVAEVVDTLNSGWITTGPKVAQLETLAVEILGVSKAVCVNSWTSGAALTFKWLGIGPGDEVILPAYTYAATALAVMHTGATPVFVDILEDFTIDPKCVAMAITAKTKAILAVDIGGLPCKYDELRAEILAESVKENFTPVNDVQRMFGRPVIVADAAHSLGAMYKGASAALAADITIYSLHAVKNVTTAEGGLVCFSLPLPFDNERIYHWMKLSSLNGQTKDAFSKQKGDWRYDIITDGLKINMPDICAAVGLAQLRKYQGSLLPARKDVFKHYAALLAGKAWAIMPLVEDEKRSSSYHLFQLRLKDFSEHQRDLVIKKLAEADIASNVHFIPLPLLTLFKNLGYQMEQYPVAYASYANEISLPLYPQLTSADCMYIIETLESAYFEVA
jgi:dTDP-4-amino-4,6-dideoxygalactose transaminase